MTKFRSLASILACLLFTSIAIAQPKPSIQYVDAFKNVNHPEVAYWFFDLKTINNEATYLQMLDSLALNSKYTLVYITARNGVNFYDVAKMHPIFEKLVAHAHDVGIEIGLQLWENRDKVPEALTERSITETEIMLDDNGGGNGIGKAKNIRNKKLLFKSDLLKAFAFKKTSEGFYEKNSVQDVTSKLTTTLSGDSAVNITAQLGASLKGYTLYVLTQHYYNYYTNHGDAAANNLAAILDAYKDIPFDAVGLDEYTNLRVATTWELKKANDVFRQRAYSLPMAKEYLQKTGIPLEKDLFNIRYAPQDNDSIRIKAINNYMSLLREGTMHVEKVIYQKGKALFGKNTFIGLHNTHHNFLDGDEIWQTGLNWWNVPRDYGHTDESTPLPTQMGIGYCYPKPVLYNMFYDKHLDTTVKKAFIDLNYGIRTHYHAINDVQGWGVSMEKPATLAKINKVENCARLLNHFNTAFPEIKLLVVFGMEALANWYPNTANRGLSDINDQLKIEEKAKQLWNAGYLNALVPSELITQGRLILNAQGKPMLNGHTFDAIIYLYPEYATNKELAFFENYVKKGGKLMVEGNATHNFNGANIQQQWNNLKAKCTQTNFSLDAIPSLGIEKNPIPNGCKTEDGAYIIHDYEAFRTNQPTKFTLSINGNAYSGEYTGYLAIKADNNGVQKLAGYGFKSLFKNGQPLLQLSAPADVVYTNNKALSPNPTLTIADPTKSISLQ